MSWHGIGGVLAIWHDVVDGQEAAVRDWYSREHHFERLSVPGFVETRRHDKVEGDGQAVLCLYGVESAAVLASAAYRARLAAPSAWTRAVMPHYRNMSRTVCVPSAHHGRAQGGVVASMAASGGAAPAAETVRDALSDVPGVLRWCCMAAAQAVPAPAATAETALRGGVDESIAWAVIVDAHDLASGRAALAALQGCKGEARRSALYRLAFAARRDETEGRP